MSNFIVSESVSASKQEKLCLRCWGFNSQGMQLVYAGIHANVKEAIEQAHITWKGIKTRYNRIHYKVFLNDHCIASGTLDEQRF